MKNKINVLTALICAFALSVVSLNFVEAATGTSGFTYKSQGRIVYDGGTPETLDDVVFDASDFSTIDQMVVDGKNQVMSKLNEYKDENGNSKLNLSGLQSFADLTNAINNLTNGTNATAGQILTGQKAIVGKNLVTGTMPNNGAITQSLNAGGSYTIPAGYHNGQGKITASACTSTHVNNQDGGTITPGTSNRTITPDSSHTGLSQVIVRGDSDLIAENIKSGVNIFGVEGSLNSSSGSFEVAKTGKFSAKWNYYSNVSSPWKKSVDITVDRDYSQLICIGSNTASSGWAPGVHFTYKDQDLGMGSVCIQNVSAGDTITIWHSQSRDLSRTDVTFTTTYTLVGGY